MRTLFDFGFNGKDALIYCIEESEYKTMAQAVASLSVFTNPISIEETQGKHIFKIVRSSAKRGDYGEVGGAQVLYDDNTGPRDTFLWANGLDRSKFQDVTFCHITAQSGNVKMYTSLANICMIPSFLAKLTDTDSLIKSLLKFRAHQLYGSFVNRNETILKPDFYDEIKWADPHSPVKNLEETLRNAMKTKPKNRATKSARELGWFFSNYEPDSHL